MLSLVEDSRCARWLVSLRAAGTKTLDGFDVEEYSCQSDLLHPANANAELLLPRILYSPFQEDGSLFDHLLPMFVDHTALQSYLQYQKYREKNRKRETNCIPVL